MLTQALLMRGDINKYDIKDILETLIIHIIEKK